MTTSRSDPADLERLRTQWGIPAPPAEPVADTMWPLAVLEPVMVEVVARHPQWVVVRYQDILDDPLAAFRSMTERVGLPWNEAAEDLVRASDAPGRRYETIRPLADAR